MSSFRKRLLEKFKRDQIERWHLHQLLVWDSSLLLRWIVLIGIPRHDGEKRNGRTQHRRSIRKYNKSWNAAQQGSPAMKSISLIRMIVLPNSFNALRSAAFPPSRMETY